MPKNPSKSYVVEVENGGELGVRVEATSRKCRWSRCKPKPARQHKGSNREGEELNTLGSN